MITRRLLLAGGGLVGLGTLGSIGPAMAQERILISSDWGKVTAELVDNDATRSLLRMLPLTIENLQSAFALARRAAAARFLNRNARTLEFQSLCHLLPRRPRPSARDYLARARER